VFNWATISANAQTMRGVIEQMQNARLHSIGVESVGASAALYRQICESRRNYNSVASSLTNRTVEPSPCRAVPGRAGPGGAGPRAEHDRHGPGGPTSSRYARRPLRSPSGRVVVVVVVVVTNPEGPARRGRDVYDVMASGGVSRGGDQRAARPL